MTLCAKDRLILALCAKLSAERETRQALGELVAAGNFDPDVLSAILSDPVPVVAQEDLNAAEQVLAMNGISGAISHYGLADS